MKKRAKKQQVTATATATLVKQEEQPSTQPEPELPSTPEPEERATESTPEEVAVETEVTPPETAEEAPEPAETQPEEEEPKQEEATPEPKPTDDVCGPLGKLCTCARSSDSLPRVPTAILVERHGERLRKHEDKLDDLHEANRVILDKMLSLKDQIAVSYGLSLVLAIVVCVLALTK